MNTSKFPILPTVIESYRILLRNLSLYVRLIWFPFIATCAFYSIFFVVENETYTGLREVVYLFFLSILGFLVFLLAVSPIVSWHRFIILGQYKNSWHFRFSLRKEEWRYIAELITFVVLFGFFLGLIYGGIKAGLSSIIDLGPAFAPSIEGRIVLSLSAGVACLPVTYFLLILPSVTVGRRLSYREAKLNIKGNFLRIWAAYVLAFMPQRIIFHILEVTEQYTGAFDVAGVINGFYLLSVLNDFLFYTISIGVMSIAYKFCAEGQMSQFEKPVPENS